MAEITQKLVDGAGLQTAMGIMGNYSDNMDRGVLGGYNQSFPLKAATKGNIYYHKPTNRYYICINNYSGSSLTNPNSKFEELSVYTNRQRLDNLPNFKFEIGQAFVSGGRKTTINFDKPFDRECIAVFISDVLPVDTGSFFNYGITTNSLTKSGFELQHSPNIGIIFYLAVGR